MKADYERNWAWKPPKESRSAVKRAEKKYTEYLKTLGQRAEPKKS